MTTARLLVVVMLAGLVGACSLLPEWRLFQTKIDPKLADKPAEQIEGERKAAAFIRDNSEKPTADLPAQLGAIHAVAVPLASSLGEPKTPNGAGLVDEAKIIAELRQGLIAEQRKAEQWRAFARKYAGKPIEDTGINIAGPAGLIGIVAVIALCVAVPPIGWAILRALPLLWGFFRRTTEAIGEFGNAHPDAGKQLAENLSRRMDNAHKRLVRKRVAAPARLPTMEGASAS